MSNIDLIKELKEEIGIEIPTLTNSIQDRHFSNILKAEELLYNNIQTILEDSSLSLSQKQKKLEKLTQQSKNYKINQDFSIPNSVKKVISKIDDYIVETLNEKKEENWLPANIMKNLCKDKPIKKQIVTDKKKPVLEFFHTSLKLFELRENSFGLFLCSILIFFLRTRSKQSLDDDNSTKRNEFQLDYENNSYTVGRLALVSTLGSQFREFVRGAKSLVENELLEKAYRIKRSEKRVNLVNKTLSVDDKIKLVEKTLKPQEASFYEFLVLDEQLQEILYIENEKTGIIESELGIILLTFLESVELVIDEGKMETMSGKNPKTYAVLKISDDHISSIFKIPFSPANLPLVSEPKRWVKDNSNPKQNFGKGGFHFNEKENTQGILSSQLTKGITKLTDSEINGLNYLQSNVYNINKKFLNALKINAIYMLNIYGERTGLLTSKFVLSSCPDKLVIRDSESFLEVSDEYAELKVQIANGIKKKSKIRRLRNLRKYLLDEYSKYVNVLINFIHFLYIATLFKNYNFYFVLYMDTRGRFYYSSARNSFGLQSSNMSKYVIELVGNVYYDSDINQPCPEKESDAITKRIDVEDWLFIRENSMVPALDVKEYYKIKSSFIGVDASCSGTSIISGLIGYEEGMMLTNVICSNDETQISEKKCIYSKFLEHLRYNMDRREDIFPEAFVLKTAKSNNITVINLNKILDLVFEAVKKHLIVRRHVKEFVMCQNYAQQNQGRTKYIDENFLNTLTLMGMGHLGDLITYKLRMAISSKIAQWIGKNYKIFFPELDEFCLLVRTKLSHKKPLTLCANNNQTGEFEIGIQKGKPVKSTKPDFTTNNRKKINGLSYFVTTGKIDRAKSSRASVANFIHFLDSRLCSKVIQKCSENRILIWTNHDCFYTSSNNIELVKSFYFESYVEILLESDTCDRFFTANDVEKPEIVNKFLEKTAKKREKILRKIRKGVYVQSEHILN